MKTISPALQAGIDNGTVATCVKITREDNTVLGFTDHDIPLTIDSVTYDPTPALQSIKMNIRSNAEVSNQEFAGAWVVDLEQTDLSNGLYDNATVEVFRADWSTPASGTVNVFTGNLGLIQWTEDGFRADTHSTMKRLSRPIGTQVTAKCRHQLFAPASSTRIGYCGIAVGLFTYTGSVSSITTQKLKFTISSIGQPDHWITNGIFTWTSGNNNGASFEVKSFVSNVVELFLPTTFTITAGDTFSVTAGCDKTLATCKTKYSNSINFGAFPHIRNEINFK